MNKEQESGIAIGLNNMGAHVGSGIAWLGFWVFLGMLVIEIDLSSRIMKLEQEMKNEITRPKSDLIAGISSQFNSE